MATCGSSCHYQSFTLIVLHPRTRPNWPYLALMFACKLYTVHIKLRNVTKKNSQKKNDHYLHGKKMLNISSYSFDTMYSSLVYFYLYLIIGGLLKKLSMKNRKEKKLKHFENWTRFFSLRHIEKRWLVWCVNLLCQAGRWAGQLILQLPIL